MSLADTGYKQFLLSFTASMMLVSSVVIITAFLNVSYLPFKSKQLSLLGLAFFASICYFLSILQIYQIVDSQGVFSLCYLWFFVAQLLLGVNLIALVLSMRMYRLYFLIVLSKPAEGFQFYWPLVLSYLPSLFLALLPLFSSGLFTPTPTVGVNSKDGVAGCLLLSYPFLYALYGAVLLQIGFLWALTFRVSRVQIKSFNEYKENVIINAIATVLLFLSFGMVMFNVNDSIAGKSILLIASTVFGIVSWIGPLISPFIGFVFFRDEYLYSWKMGLRNESELPSGMRYGLNSGGSSQSRDTYQRNNYNYSGQGVKMASRSA